MPLKTHEGKLKDLRAIKKVFDKLNLPMLLCYGTALGAYRDGDFLPGDKDIDVGTFGEENKDRIWQELKKEGFRKRGDDPWERYKCVPVERNTIVDLFLFVKNVSYAKGVNVCARIPKECPGLEKIEFFGDEYLVPSPIESYLQRCYGNWKDKESRKHGR